MKKMGEDAKADTAVDADAPTRTRVAASVLQNGPSTATELAERLELTPAAIRRHLARLIDDGVLESRPERNYGPRGRGRPALEYVLTDAGRGSFYQAYDELASEAIDMLVESKGSDAITDLADRRFAAVIEQFAHLRNQGREQALETLAEALSEEGFVANVRPAVLGDQLCQYHCPVANVAANHPELCEAETQIFSRLLDSHVQRLATIAHGDGVCTTHIPREDIASHIPREDTATHTPHEDKRGSDI